MHKIDPLDKAMLIQRTVQDYLDTNAVSVYSGQISVRDVMKQVKEVIRPIGAKVTRADRLDVLAEIYFYGPAGENDKTWLRRHGGVRRCS